MGRTALEDVTVWYEGQGTGPPLVFLHGSLMSADAWQRQIDHFTETHRVITVDFRGHGKTGATDRQRYSIELFADDLEQLLDYLDIERPILCGISLGAMVVQEYLDRHPARAPGAILGGPLRSMPPVAFPNAGKPFVSPLPALTSSLSIGGTKATFRSLLFAIRATTGRPWLSTDQSIRKQAIDDVGDISRREFRKIFASLYRYDPSDLSAVTTPTLAIYGDQEAPPIKRQGRQIVASVDEGYLTTVSDAGHLVNQDEPEAFNGAVTEFLSRIDDPRYGPA